MAPAALLCAATVFEISRSAGTEMLRENSVPPPPMVDEETVGVMLALLFRLL